MEQLIKKAARDLVNSEYAIALTGAGISTESGIRDFRGPDGVWTKNPDAFRRLEDVLRASGVLDDCRTVARELLRGLIHSVLVTFDGGTALAEHVRLDIVDNNGRIFDKYLHELFYNHLFETGRMGELS